jgi:hypothetical protein
MRHLKYVMEKAGKLYELIPDWNAVAILSKFNGIKKWEDPSWELHPEKAFIFEDIDTCEQFIENFDKIQLRYDEILSEGTVYYVVHDLTILKANGYNYADRLVGRSKEVLEAFNS